MNLFVLLASDSRVGLDEVVVIAQSVGAVLVATWVHDYARLQSAGWCWLLRPLRLNCMYRWHVLRWRYGIVCVVCFY